MKASRGYKASIFLLLILLTTGCASLSVQDSQLAPEAQSRQFDRIAVYIAAPVSLQRAGYERRVVNTLQEMDVNAVAFSDIPGLSGRMSREKAIRVLPETDVNAVVTVFVTRLTEDQSYVRNDEASDPWWDIEDDGSEVYEASIGDGRHPSSDSAENYTTYSQAVYLESSLIDVSDGANIWRMTVKAKDPEYYDISEALGKEIAKALHKNDLLR